MKRTIIGLVAATVMGGGLVGVSVETAGAACPYTGCVPTSIRVNVVNAPVSKGQKAKICVRVRTSGSGEPRGHVKIAVTRNNGGFRWIDTKRQPPGARTCFQTPRLKRAGKHTVRATYFAAPRSPFGDSSNVTALHVRRR